MKNLLAALVVITHMCGKFAFFSFSYVSLLVNNVTLYIAFLVYHRSFSR